MGIEWIAMLAIVGLLAIFFGLFYGSVIATRRVAERKAERAARLGFKPVDPSDTAFQQTIVALHRKRERQQLDPRNVFSRQGQDSTFYLFDLWDTSGEDSQLIENGVGVISPMLSLPRFSVQPRIPGSGVLANLSNRLLEKAMTVRPPLALEGCPRFDEHFFVLTPDPPAAQVFLTPALRNRMAALKSGEIEAGGEAFSLAGLHMKNAKEADPEMEINQILREASELIRWFGESRGREHS
jgi:hypothetical protein